MEVQIKSQQAKLRSRGVFQEETVEMDETTESRERVPFQNNCVIGAEPPSPENSNDDIKTASQLDENGELKTHFPSPQRRHKQKPVFCTLCNKSFANRWCLTRHVSAVHDKLRLPCTQCDKSFSTKSGLASHIGVVHELRLVPCTLCDKSFTSKTSLTQHVNSVHHKLKPFSCTLCDKSFTQRGALTYHVNAVHRKLRHISCTLCDKSFYAKNTLTKHINTVHHKLKPFSCTLCDKSFPNNGILTRHVDVVHNKVKCFPCTLCNRSFAVKGCLTLHINAVHKKLKPFSCALCDKSFAIRLLLTKHIDAVHHKLKPFSCKLCNKSFAQKPYLTNHIAAVHHKSRTFSCRLCDKSFSWSSYLATHINRVHHKLRPFSCTLCNKSFTDKGTLTNHVNGVHRKLKPFSCTLCHKSFACKYYLAKHVDAVHHTFFFCTQCEESFTTNRALTAHVDVAHPKQKHFSCPMCNNSVCPVHQKRGKFCSMCGLSFATDAQMSSHKRFYCKSQLTNPSQGEAQHDNNEKDFPLLHAPFYKFCSMCGLTFSTDAQLSTHKRFYCRSQLTNPSEEEAQHDNNEENKGESPLSEKGERDVNITLNNEYQIDEDVTQMTGAVRDNNTTVVQTSASQMRRSDTKEMCRGVNTPQINTTTETDCNLEKHTNSSMLVAVSEDNSNVTSTVLKTGSDPGTPLKQISGRCQFCGLCFVKGSLKRHEQFCRSIYQSKNQKPSKDISEMDIDSRTVNSDDITDQIKTVTTTHTNGENQNHPYLASDSNYVACTVCNKLFTAQKYLDKHVALKHSNSHSTSTDKISCSVCEARFNNMMDYTHHLNVHLQTADKPIIKPNRFKSVLNKCTICERYFTHSLPLSREEEDTCDCYKCGKCATKFDSKFQLVIHKRKNCHCRQQSLTHPSYTQNKINLHQNDSSFPPSKFTQPQGKVTCPQTKATYLQGKVTCPQTKATYLQGKVTCPQTKATYLQGKVTCSQNKATYPQGKVTSPQNNSTCSESKVTCSQNKATYLHGKDTCAKNMSTYPQSKFTHPQGKVTYPRNKSTCPQGKVICSQDKVTSHQSRFACDWCPLIFSNIESRNTHTKTMHNIDLFLPCIKCNKQCTSYSELAEHQKACRQSL